MNKSELKHFYKSDGTSDFLLIEKNKIYFWGINIPARVISVNNRLERKIKTLQIPRDEVIEIFDDPALKLFETVYTDK